MDEGDKDLNTGGFCSQGVKDEDDRRSESSFPGDSVDSNSILLSSMSLDLADDATYSSPNSSTLSSDFSSLSLEAKPPVKRGLYRFFEGKSKSFRCLSEVRCIEDLAKQKTPSSKRLNASGECGFNSMQKRCNKPIIYGRTISKKTTSKGSSVFWQARRNRNGGLPSSKKNSQPAENLQYLLLLNQDLGPKLLPAASNKVSGCGTLLHCRGQARSGRKDQSTTKNLPAETHCVVHHNPNFHTTHRLGLRAVADAREEAKDRQCREPREEEESSGELGLRRSGTLRSEAPEIGGNVGCGISSTRATGRGKEVASSGRSASVLGQRASQGRREKRKSALGR